VFVFNVIRDISFRKDLDKQLFNTIVETQENERQRFAKDIHDGIGSYLTSLITYINLLASSKISVMEMPDIFEEMKELVMEAAEESKNIANDLIPDVLNNFGLVAGIKNLAKHIFVDGNMQMIFECGNFVEPHNKMLKTALFRIVNELFNNAVKYSHGTKMILILETEGNYTRLKYVDDGVGFETEEVMKRIQDKKVSGLKNIQGRVANFNGTFDIKTSLGNGLEINIIVLN
jgi:signal transduction histidine kinase